MTITLSKDTNPQAAASVARWIAARGDRAILRRSPRSQTLGPSVLRGLLLVVCACSVAAAWRSGDPSAALLADPELARLLRGMAVLKALMVFAAIVLVTWRFGHPIAARIAAGYGLGVALMAASATMIWQLTALLPAAAAFHAGLVIALLVAWRGDGGLPHRKHVLGSPPPVPRTRTIPST